MVTPEDIARINELARKKKATGLTADETIEQAKLLRGIHHWCKIKPTPHVESIKVVDPEGNDITLKKLKKHSLIKAYEIHYKDEKKY